MFKAQSRQSWQVQQGLGRTENREEQGGARPQDARSEKQQLWKKGNQPEKINRCMERNICQAQCWQEAASAGSSLAGTRAGTFSLLTQGPELGETLAFHVPERYSQGNRAVFVQKESLL